MKGKNHAFINSAGKKRKEKKNEWGGGGEEEFFFFVKVLQHLLSPGWHSSKY